MAKFTSTDMIRILRLFGRASDDDTTRLIERLSTSHPHDKNSLFTFVFKKQPYYVLVDGTADDDIDYIQQQVDPHGNVSIELVQNPDSDYPTFGLPYKGKDVYLCLPADTKVRLDIWLTTNHVGISRSTWQKHIKAGRVFVNGVAAPSAKFEVSPDDEIEAKLPEQTDFSTKTLPVIYLDENVIVVNKPAGILTHAKGALSDEFTVAEFFRRYTTYHLDTNRPGIIHRLDRDTSGVIIGARNDATARMLQKQFAVRNVKKTYIAICNGIPKQAKAHIDIPIGRNPNAPSTFRPDAKGKSATTTYEVAATHDDRSLLYLYPQTGRTHQLRVHLAHLGTPIRGDRVYGRAAERMYLHAYRLEITIPDSDRRLFEAPIPAEFLEDFTI